jgi:transcriptional regulator with XRE-family HTH domain
VVRPVPPTTEPSATKLVGVDRSDHVGSYIRAWRQRAQPQAVGLPVRAPRRTSGLRREELAALAGISVDYLVRLEQGRPTNPSTQVLASLARALRLSDNERDHLYTVAGYAPPKRTAISSHIAASVQRLVDRLDDVPLAVYDAAWTTITWNPAWAALMGDPSVHTGRDRNLLWRTFTRASTRVYKTAEEITEFETAAVADLRRVLGNYPDDCGLQQLIDDLLKASPRFAELWRQRNITLEGTSRKTIVHPDLGPISLDCDVLTVAGSDLRIVVYTAEPSSLDSEKLDLIRVIGLQRLTAETAPVLVNAPDKNAAENLLR